MLAVAAETVIVVDCGADLVQRLLSCGLELDRIELLVLTHEHPDHVGGFPLFMERIWLAGRRRPIEVCGPARALDQARRIYEAFDTSGWEGLPEIAWTEVALEEGAVAFENDEWRVTTSPGEHSVPVIALRAEYRRTGRVAVYSSDTGPAESIRRLASGSEILVHEATGAFPGHSTIADAARIARDAEAGRLVLVHLPPRISQQDLREARKVFGPIELGEDGGSYPI